MSFNFEIKKQLLRIDEVCEILNCCKSHVYDLLREGYITAHNVKQKPGCKGTRIVSQSVSSYLNYGLIPVEAWLTNRTES